ncbi:type III secretion system export apparatus subunit SctU [Rhizobacter sp. SG703]|uniref:type III secretion system export apparatus subunit SctU n=1 Tax=Rhizobacter sp. SG703 TaxID=2587140 RepID=UPI001445EAA8|nr:type III secretion protein U [Rhizobacter sp. SG703]
MSGEKTEQPTYHRLKQAREDGQVARSKDFTETVLLAALFGWTLAMSEDLVREMTSLMLAPAGLYQTDFRTAVASLGMHAVHALVSLTLPFLLIVVVVGIAVEAAQTGLVFSLKPLVPKGDKLDPVKNLQNMFSIKSLVEFLKSNLKVILLTVIITVLIRDFLDPLVKVPPAGMPAVGAIFVAMLKKLVIWTFLAYGVLAFADLVWQRRQHIKQLMMSLDEIKQEHKQMEGDPEVKSHRKELAKEIAMGETAHQTRKASVVVTNPTHFAVAIRYEQDVTPLPIVTAKGADEVAHMMVRVAREAGVPVLQNIPLARGLTRSATLHRYVPTEFIEPVAELLRELQRLALERGEGESS